MPTKNLVGMVVLSLALVGGMAFLALRSGNGHAGHPNLDGLIRKLGDTDPDLRRDAERELKELGRKAEPALKEAAKGPDPAVAERARAILGLKHPEAPPVDPGSVAGSAEGDPVATGVRLTLQIASPPRRSGEPVLYYLRLHNGTKHEVTVARDPRFGGFERVDGKGRVAPLVVASLPEEAEPVELVTVAPGESIDLSPQSGLLRIEGSGTVRVRYVYDASEGSDYREELAAGHRETSALPAERLVSNEVSVTLP